MDEQMNNEMPDTVDGEAKINPAAIRKSTTQSILKAASAASGLEFDSVESMAAALARLSASQSGLQQSQPQPVQQQEPQQRRITTNDLQEQFVSLKQDLAKKEQALRERELDGEIRMVMGDKFDPDLLEYALTKVRSNIQWDTDGSYAITNSKGQIRYGDDGNPMTISGLVNEVAKANPKLLRRAEGAQTGSGLRQSGGMFGGEAESMPDYVTNPDAFNAWANRNGIGRGVGLKNVRASVSVHGQSKKIV